MTDIRFEPVAPRDGVWLQDQPSNLMVINCVMSLDHITVERLREVWQERVMAVDGGRRYARFRQLLVRQGRRVGWSEDADFRIERHIFTIDNDNGALSSKEGFQAYIGEQAAQPLPTDRPPWQIQLIENFDDGGSAMVSRLHHVMADGMSLMPVIFSLMDLAEETGSQRPVKTRGTPGRPWLIAAKAALVGGPLLLSRALMRADRSLVHGPNLSGRKKVAWTAPLDLEQVKAIKNRHDATVNDVLMTCVAGGFQRYQRRHPGTEIPSLRVSMPVNLRPPDEVPKMENRFAAVMFSLPVEIEEPKARLQETQRRMAKLKKSVEPLVYYGAINVLAKVLPHALHRWTIDFYASKCSAVMSNVPGPQEPLSIAGRRVRAMLFWVPQRANIGLGISILSFAGEVRVGLFTDVALIPEPTELIEDIEQEFEHLGNVL